MDPDSQLFPIQGCNNPKRERTPRIPIFKQMWKLRLREGYLFAYGSTARQESQVEVRPGGSSTALTMLLTLVLHYEGQGCLAFEK